MIELQNQIVHDDGVTNTWWVLHGTMGKRRPSGFPIDREPVTFDPVMLKCWWHGGDKITIREFGDSCDIERTVSVEHAALVVKEITRGHRDRVDSMKAATCPSKRQPSS